MEARCPKNRSEPYAEERKKEKRLPPQGNKANLPGHPVRRLVNPNAELIVCYHVMTYNNISKRGGSERGRCTGIVACVPDF